VSADAFIAHWSRWYPRIASRRIFSALVENALERERPFSEEPDSGKKSEGGIQFLSHGAGGYLVQS
jgi:hypothetical protein